MSSIRLKARAVFHVENGHGVEVVCGGKGVVLYPQDDGTSVIAPTSDPLIVGRVDLHTPDAIDAVYLERNRCVALIAKMTIALGYTAGIRTTEIDGWDPEWHNCVFIDLPTGQVSWHYHDRDADLFAGLPPYTAPWDGHDTPTKYDRVADAVFSRRSKGILETIADLFVGEKGE